MSRELCIRPAREEDLGAMLELMKASLGDGMPRDPEFFRWKHVHNASGRSLILVAEDAEGMVGLRAMMRWRFLQGGRIVHAVRPVDTATHPRFRRRGLFTRLTKQLLSELASHGVEMVFNTPNDQSRPGYLKMGWQSVGTLPIWVRPGGRWSLRGGRPPESGLTPPNLDDGRLVSLRDPMYWAWRYGEAAGISYTSFGDGDAGVVVRQRARNGKKELTIVEVVAPQRSDIGRAASVLRKTVRASTSDYAIAMASPDTREAAVLLLAGFVCVPNKGPHLVARHVEGKTPPQRFTSPEGWRVQIGDLEVF